jgi:hypothetical protein
VDVDQEHRLRTAVRVVTALRAGHDMDVLVTERDAVLARRALVTAGMLAADRLGDAVDAAGTGLVVHGHAHLRHEGGLTPGGYGAT